MVCVEIPRRNTLPQGLCLFWRERWFCISCERTASAVARETFDDERKVGFIVEKTAMRHRRGAGWVMNDDDVDDVYYYKC